MPLKMSSQGQKVPSISYLGLVSHIYVCVCGHRVCLHRLVCLCVFLREAENEWAHRRCLYGITRLQCRILARSSGFPRRRRPADTRRLRRANPTLDKASKQHAINDMSDIIHGNEQMTLHYEPHVLPCHSSIERSALQTKDAFRAVLFLIQHKEYRCFFPLFPGTDMLASNQK